MYNIKLIVALKNSNFQKEIFQEMQEIDINITTR